MYTHPTEWHKTRILRALVTRKRGKGTLFLFPKEEEGGWSDEEVEADVGWDRFGSGEGRRARYDVYVTHGLQIQFGRGQIPRQPEEDVCIGGKSGIHTGDTLF